MFRLHNSLGREMQDFKPTKPGKVLMYTCGPTVWNYAHIGNFRTFVFEDVLRRYLRFKGFDVVQVMNITDVEDRIIQGINSSGKPLPELTKFYEDAFMQDLATLNVEKAEYYPRATMHIPEMVRLIESLLERGFAYRVPDGSVYFDVSKFKGYGALSGVKIGSEKESGRVSSDHYEEKKEAIDFALWKSWDKEDGDVYWQTTLGKGRPGWHIECSAMSMKYLGESFDIHTGGMDNKFPHHENEIAQSEASSGKKFVRYWLHSGFLTVSGEEMHKSVGNVINLRELVEKGWDPKSIRLFLISARYRDPIDLTDSSLEQARTERMRLQSLVSRLMGAKYGTGSGDGLAEELLEGFESAMDEDLNTPKALSILFSTAKSANVKLDGNKIGPRGVAKLLSALKKVDSVLGVLDFKEPTLSTEALELMAKRDAARSRRDYKEADRLRVLLLEKGVVVEDTPKGTKWKLRSEG